MTGDIPVSTEAGPTAEPTPKRKFVLRKKSNFEHEIVKVFGTERVDSVNRIDLRIVRWKAASKRTLEKRRIWEKEGESRFRKLAGFTAEDVQFIVDHAEEILRLLREE